VLPQAPQVCRKIWERFGAIPLPFLVAALRQWQRMETQGVIGNLAKAIKRGHSFVAQD
jgi:hypothetical protein